VIDASVVAETARVPESLFPGSWNGVPEPDPDRGDVDGALVDLFALVITGGDGTELLELAEAAFKEQARLHT
jgi:hypothetical protein